MNNPKLATLNALIEKSQELTSLLSEYQEALRYESCDYAITGQPEPFGFLLMHNKTGNIMVAGRSTRIHSYIRLHGIDTTKIFHYGAIGRP